MFAKTIADREKVIIDLQIENARLRTAMTQAMTACYKQLPEEARRILLDAMLFAESDQ